MNSITFNKRAEDDNDVIIKAYVDQFHQEKEQSRPDVGLDSSDETSDSVKNNWDIDFNDKKITNIDSVTVKRNPSLYNELANKKCNDDEIDKNTILRFIQTLEIYRKVSVGSDVYNLTKWKKISITDLTLYTHNSVYK